MFCHKKLCVILGLALPILNACGTGKKAMHQNEEAKPNSAVPTTTSIPAPVPTEEEAKHRHTLTRDLSSIRMLHPAVEAAIGYKAERQALQRIREELAQVHKKSGYQALRTFVEQTPSTALATEACGILFERLQDWNAAEVMRELAISGHQSVLTDAFQAACQNNTLARTSTLVESHTAVHMAE